VGRYALLVIAGCMLGAMAGCAVSVGTYVAYVEVMHHREADGGEVMRLLFVLGPLATLLGAAGGAIGAVRWMRARYRRD
jgi:hypothetical protein